MLRDKIVFTVTGKLQELLLREDNLTLKKVVKFVELSNSQVDKSKNSEKEQPFQVLLQV